jgi:hypothetical protein
MIGLSARYAAKQDITIVECGWRKENLLYTF